MTSLRRTRRKQETTAAPRSSKTGSAAVQTPSVSLDSVSLSEHVERALISLTANMQQVVERLDIIDHRIDELYEQTMSAPSHADVMEVRMHSAKLAAELARSTVELRGEIGMASDEARRQARIARSAAEEPTVAMPVDIELVEEDHDDDEGQGHSGWSATA